MFSFFFLFLEAEKSRLGNAFGTGPLGFCVLGFWCPLPQNAQWVKLGRTATACVVTSVAVTMEMLIGKRNWI